MARSKNATALFEVIHAAKKPPKSSTTVSVPTPKWWAKSKPKAAATKPVEASDTAGKQGSWLAAAAKRGVLPTAVSAVESNETHSTDDAPERSTVADHGVDFEPEAPEYAAVAELPQETAPKPRFAERFADRFAKRTAAAVPLEPVAPIEIPDARPADETSSFEPEDNELDALAANKRIKPKALIDDMLSVDRAAKEIQFRLSYGGMIAIGFILLLLVALAFLVGSRSGLWAAADSQEGLKKNSTPADATTGMALSVGPTTPAELPPVVEAPPIVQPEVPAVTRHIKPQPVPESNESPRPIVPSKQVREVGTLYVVVQSYDDQQIAQKACDYLNKAGVPCSLVQGLDGWAPKDWYSVVGFQPFNSKDPTLVQYQQLVTALGLKFSNKVYNQFEPKPYNWRVDSDVRSNIAE